MAEAEIFKFCGQVGHVKCYPWNDKPLPPNGRGQGHVTHFFNFGTPYHRPIFPTVKPDISNSVSRLIVVTTRVCVIDYPQMGCVHGHVTFKFW